MAERGWSMEVKGLRNLERVMREKLPATTNRKILLASMRSASKPMVEAARARVPGGGSGALARSIGMKTIRNRGNSKVFASMTISPLSGKLDVWAQYMAHYGRTINITSKSGKVDAGKVGRIRHGHLVEFGFKHTSGKQVAARPFLRPAFDERSAGLVNDFRKNLGVKVDNAVRKIGKKGK